MSGMLSRAKDLRERLYPVLKESAFAERGVLTPEEFVAAGDELVYKCPTWAWSGGEASKRKPHLPADKQYLVTNNVPCAARASALERSAVLSNDVDEEGADAWVSTDVDGRAAAPNASGPDGGLGEIPSSKEAAGGVDDLAALEETGIAGEDDDANVAQCGEAFEDCDDNILRTRTYDLSITYDKYWQTPRMWLFGYDEQQNPLTQKLVFEDIISDYARRTVTFEMHPHLSAAHASIHPCKHPAVMKRILENLSSGNKAPPSPDQAMFIFLKFIQNVIPTINYDFTLEVAAG